MIVGVGVGIVETERFRAADRRFGERLRSRLFTAGERTYAARKGRAFESLAARFATKLAARRALGLAGARWQDLELVRERGRAPRLVLHARARQAAERRGVVRTAVSVTHDADLCLAQVVLEADG